MVRARSVSIVICVSRSARIASLSLTLRRRSSIAESWSRRRGFRFAELGDGGGEVVRQAGMPRREVGELPAQAEGRVALLAQHRLGFEQAGLDLRIGADEVVHRVGEESEILLQAADLLEPVDRGWRSGRGSVRSSARPHRGCRPAAASARPSREPDKAPGGLRRRRAGGGLRGGGASGSVLPNRFRKVVQEVFIAASRKVHPGDGPERSPNSEEPAIKAAAPAKSEAPRAMAELQGDHCNETASRPPRNFMMFLRRCDFRRVAEPACDRAAFERFRHRPAGRPVEKLDRMDDRDSPCPCRSGSCSRYCRWR